MRFDGSDGISNSTGYWTFSMGGESKAVETHIDPKTLKPCKHCWAPNIAVRECDWSLRPECIKCGITGTPKDKGIDLRKLVGKMGR